MDAELIWGARAVEEALTSGSGVNRVFFAAGANVQRHDAIAEAARAAGVRVEHIPLAKLNHLTRRSDHQGVAAALSPVRYRELKNLFAAMPPRAVIAVLDRVQHARNLGMLIRSAAGAGAAAVIFPQRGGAMVDATVIRASAGTAFRVPLAPVQNMSQAIRMLKDHDFWVYGLSASAETSVFEMDWPARTAIVVGNESEGLRPGVEKNCDAFVRIPLAKGVESLNAAVAGSIVLFQAARIGAK